jgi:hypothetical protein
MLKLTKLFQKTSKNGNTYFVGRLGAAKVVLLKDNKQEEGSDPVWNLLLDEAQDKRNSNTRQEQQPERRDRAVSAPNPEMEDAMPF